MLNPTPLRFEDALLLSAVLLLPWAFAGVEIWAYRSAELLLIGAASVALGKHGFAGCGLAGRNGLWLAPALLLGAWAGLQLVPLPPAVVRTLDPTAHRIRAAVLPEPPVEGGGGLLANQEAAALREVPEAAAYPLPTGPGPGLQLEPPRCLAQGWFPLSLQPSATQERTLWYLALLAGFLLIRERVADPAVYALYRAALIAGFTGLAAFGLIQARTWNGKIYWLRQPTVHSEPFGPYLSSTHFSGLMELAVPWIVGYVWQRMRVSGRQAYRGGRFALAVVAAGICTVAAVGSASKAGIVLLAGALGALGLVGARTWRARLVVLLLGAAVVVGGAVMLEATRLGDRARNYLATVEPTELLEGRYATWRSTVTMIADFPLTGTGFGAFREVFPRYMPPGSSGRWSQAHNDYLELASDGGLIAVALLLWLVGAYWARVVGSFAKGWADRSTSRLGLAAGLAALGLHAVFDFNHQVPGTALLFVALAAMLLQDEPALPGAAAHES